MKKVIFFIAIMLIASYSSNAQMTLAASYPMSGITESEIVDLSISGKKILTVNHQVLSSDTLYFYNMDYSFWKKIILPVIPGHRVAGANLYDNGGGLGAINVFYPSETLYNSDSFLEVGAFYYNTLSSISTFYVINENGVLVDSITNVSTNTAKFSVFETSPGVFKATIPTINGVSIYDLPGTIPCNACGSYLGIAKTEKQKAENNIITQPQPNPSSSEVKITFTLPEGVNHGELVLYNSNGQKLKVFEVDNRFGFIMLDNSRLPSGVYYYNIVANGAISSTQKMVLVR